jgi:hypothetical protein
MIHAVSAITWDLGAHSMAENVVYVEVEASGQNDRQIGP